MKKILIYLAAASALLLSAACTQEKMERTSGEGKGIFLQLVWSSPATRATATAGENNENTVKTLDFYFFKDTTAQSVFHYSAEAGTDGYVAFSEKTGTDGSYTKDFVPGEDEFPDKSDLLRSDGYCTVFVVANLDNAPASADSLGALKRIAVMQTFLRGKRALASSADAFKLIMTGEKQVRGTMVPVESASPEIIELQRLVAKFTFDVEVLKSKTVSSTATDGTVTTETWTPMLEENNVRMYLSNADTTALLGVAHPSAAGAYYPASPLLMDYDGTVVSSDDEAWDATDANYYKTKNTVGPFYTYPLDWTNGGPDISVKIIVPWLVERKQTVTVDGSTHTNVTYTAQREIYYKVLLPEPKVLPNYWYALTVTLEPGSENEPEVEVPASYQVVNWTSGGQYGINTTLKDIKYLVVDTGDADENGNFVFYTQSMSVQYSASNAVSFKVMSASYEDFSSSSNTTKTFASNGALSYNAPGTGKVVGVLSGSTWSDLDNINSVNGWFSVGQNEGLLTINHPLNNVLPSGTRSYFDATPYTFTVRIYLTRDESVYKEVTFVQYPQTFITVDKNDHGTNSGSDYYSTSVFVNSWGYGNSNATGWATVTSLDGTIGSGTNANPNMYVITTSVLSDQTKRLGDPREATYSNSSKASHTWQSAPALYGTTPTRQGPSYYLPGASSKNTTYIAPKIRIASSYGRASARNGISYNNAWDRCLAYQEDGYPAGRWRLPTAAELQYFNTLSTYGYIPSLFKSGLEYWSAASGTAVEDGNVVSTTAASVRCVYDDWYWGSDKVSSAETTFTWGDKPLN